MELILHDLKFDPNRANCGYSVGGELFLSIDGTYFPEENWYDMPYLDLKTWLPGLISFGSNHTDSCELTFMDGPYMAVLRRETDGSIVVSCLHDHRIAGKKEIYFSDFIQSVICCCRKYDRFLFENGKKVLFSKDISILKSLLDT